jgi:hypothetical protein
VFRSRRARHGILGLVLMLLGLALNVGVAHAQSILVYTGNGANNLGYTKFGVAAGKPVVSAAVLPPDLSAFDCTILPINSVQFSASQQSTFSTYLQGGGTLLALGEWVRSPTIGHSAANATMNDLASSLGSGLSIVNGESQVGFDTTTSIDAAPLTAGVGSIRYGAASTVSVSGAGASLVRLPVGVVGGGSTFVAAESIGAGVFLLSGDSSIFSDDNDTGYTAQDNATFVGNLCGSPPPPECSDLQDNDSDGQIDFGPGSGNDPGCTSATDDSEATDANPECSDEIDNDSDGQIDFGPGSGNDPGCTSATDDSEATDANPECSDEIDNDSDGQIDHPNDRGCDSAVDDSESPDPPLPACADGVDNDGDGRTDFGVGSQNDPGCSSPADDDETAFLWGRGAVGDSFSAMSTNVKRASRYLLWYGPVKVSSLSVYLDGDGGATGSQVVRGLIYRGASPGALLAETQQVTITAGDPGRWFDLSFSSPITLNPGYYWLGLHSGPNHGVARYAWDPGDSGSRRYNIDGFVNGASDPFLVGPTFSDSQRISTHARGDRERSIGAAMAGR